MAAAKLLKGSGMAVMITAGSLFLYCSQEIIGGPSDGPGPGGVVPPANGQTAGGTGGTCCTPPPPPAPEVLIDQAYTPFRFTNGRGQPDCEVWTDPKTISGFRTVTVHVEGCDNGEMQYSFGQAGFVRGIVQNCSLETSTPATIGGGAGRKLATGIFSLSPQSGNEARLKIEPRDCAQPVRVTMVGFKS